MPFFARMFYARAAYYFSGRRTKPNDPSEKTKSYKRSACGYRLCAYRKAVRYAVPAVSDRTYRQRRYRAVPAYTLALRNVHHLGDRRDNRNRIPSRRRMRRDRGRGGSKTAYVACGKDIAGYKPYGRNYYVLLFGPYVGRAAERPESGDGAADTRLLDALYGCRGLS